MSQTSEVVVRTILNSRFRKDSSSCRAFFGLRYIMKSMPAMMHATTEPTTAP